MKNVMKMAKKQERKREKKLERALLAWKRMFGHSDKPHTHSGQ